MAPTIPINLPSSSIILRPPILTTLSASSSTAALTQYLMPDIKNINLGSTMILKTSAHRLVTINSTTPMSTTLTPKLLLSPPIMPSALPSSSLSTSSSLSSSALAENNNGDDNVGTRILSLCKKFDAKVLDRQLPMANIIYKSTYIQEFCIGLFASVVASLFLQPLDTIRTNQIINKTPFLDTIRSIYSRQGIGQFYKTTKINALAFGLTYGIYFPINRYLKNENPFKIDSVFAQFLIATIPPTMISLTLVNPLWVMKSVQSASFKNDWTIIESAKHIYKTKGIKGYYAGLIFGYLNCIHDIITFTLYDILKNHFNANTEIQCSIFIGLAKTLAYLITFPLLALRVRQQVNQLSIIDNIYAIFEDSFQTLYYGFGITLLQDIPKIAIMIALYEKSVKYIIK